MSIEKQVIKKKKQPKDMRAYLGNLKVLAAILVVLTFVHAIIVNYLVTLISTFTMLMSVQLQDMKTFDFMPVSDGMSVALTSIGSFLYPIYLTDKPIWAKALAFAVFVFGIFFILVKVYKLWERYRELNYAQKGSARFTEIKELDAQYKKIDTVETTYKGDSGFPISHYKDSYYIDTDTFNTLIVGTSRSGKGVTSVIPSMDIDSRAEKQPSIIVADPKGELAGASYETLRKRGYDVEILNISNPNDGMSYNPLYLIGKYYERGDLDNAQKYTKSLTHTLFHDPKVSDPTWNNFASSMTQALILALVDYCVKTNQFEKITIRNVYNMLLKLATETVESDDPQAPPKSKLDIYMEQLRAIDQNHPAVVAYGAVEFSEGKTRSSIFTTVAGKLDDINKSAIAKMMSRHSVDFKRPGFNKSLQLIFLKKYALQRGYVRIHKDRYDFKVDERGHASLNFNTKLGMQDEITIHIGEEQISAITIRKYKRTGLTSKSNVIDPYTKEPIILDEVEIRLPDNTPILEASMQYSEKPIAIFMVVPDYDSSEHFIASVFISQLYTELARECENVEGRKCYTRVKFRLDEFGNFPTIQGMDQNLTVSLGRNILWELYIQELQQVNSKYKDDEAKTIISNCQNKVYIKSTTNETAKVFSELAGNQTVVNINRSSEKNSTKVNESVSLSSEPLIRPEELLNFTMGETMVIRPLKNRDLNNKDVRPYPIINTGETQMPRAFMTLGQWFNTDTSLNSFDIPSLHRGMSLDDNSVDFNHMFKSKGGNVVSLLLDPKKTSHKEARRKLGLILEQEYKLNESDDAYREIISASTVDSMLAANKKYKPDTVDYEHDLKYRINTVLFDVGIAEKIHKPIEQSKEGWEEWYEAHKEEAMNTFQRLNEDDDEYENFIREIKALDIDETMRETLLDESKTIQTFVFTLKSVSNIDHKFIKHMIERLRSE